MSEEVGTILVAEDSAPVRKTLVHIIRKIGFKVVECENGKVAWEFLDAESEKITAVLSDMMMPEMTGTQLLEKIRGDQRYNELPFVVLTAVPLMAKEVQEKQLKIEGFLVKPATVQKVLGILQKLFPELNLSL